MYVLPLHIAVVPLDANARVSVLHYLAYFDFRNIIKISVRKNLKSGLWQPQLWNLWDWMTAANTGPRLAGS